ncbi:Uncharacterized protein TCM_018977 [Theobroma cacao]|uniref:Uncharacterized protein n=1 Tax=Theobroma cacao TaxID=3641 RepID=A0A061ENA1_THECC|nr:Uncharacterized protein TCM_018977 [Theobroma cacao]
MDSHIDNVATIILTTASVPTATITVNGSTIAPTPLIVPPMPSVSYAKLFSDIFKIKKLSGDATSIIDRILQGDDHVVVEWVCRICHYLSILLGALNPFNFNPQPDPS